MRIKQLTLENFQDYKKCSMLIGTCFCNWKCCKECGRDLCQNMPLAQSPILDIPDEELVRIYLYNDLTSAICFGGLEPFDQFDELFNCIKVFRKYTEDDVIIYTGYNRSEINDKIEQLQTIDNIIVKFGRYIPNGESKYDEVLGITLASSNQYAEKIS
jgi:pyruvate-formate lyase-activating enzyme